MIKLELDDYKGNENKMLSKFKKKIRESNLIIEIKDRQHHVSKSEKKRMKKKKSDYKRSVENKEKKHTTKI
jgi:ribosomal protein S21